MFIKCANSWESRPILLKLWESVGKVLVKLRNYLLRESVLKDIKYVKNWESIKYLWNCASANRKSNASLGFVKKSFWRFVCGPWSANPYKINILHFADHQIILSDRE